jgi:hypothetical protein
MKISTREYKIDEVKRKLLLAYSFEVLGVSAVRLIP